MESLLTEPYFFRGLERLLIVCIALVSIFLGYKLFRHGITNVQSAEWSTSSFTFKLTKVSPGTFYSVLGTGVLIWALNTKLEYVSSGVEDSVGLNTEAEIGKSVGIKSTPARVSWLGDAPDDTEIRTYNTILGVLTSDYITSLPSKQKQGVLTAISHIEIRKNRLLRERFGPSNFVVYQKYNGDFLSLKRIPDEYVTTLTEMNEYLAENFIREQ